MVSKKYFCYVFGNNREGKSEQMTQNDLLCQLIKFCFYLPSMYLLTGNCQSSSPTAVL